MNVDYKTLDDETLLRLVARQQESALSELYDRFSRLVFSLALNTLGEPAQAEEVTQEVFLRLWQRAETYDPVQGKASTWIASLARHRAIDVYRRQRNRPEGSLLPWDAAEISGLSDNVNVERQVEASQRQQRLRQALAQLPESQRQALAYAFFQGYSHSQIAEALHEPLGTVKTRIRLAMEKLRQLLEEDSL
jgi:RNA polymerase sigma-70 factor (ECF subfamily)